MLVCQKIKLIIVCRTTVRQALLKLLVKDKWLDAPAKQFDDIEIMLMPSTPLWFSFLNEKCVNFSSFLAMANSFF